MFWDNVAGVYDLFADIFNKETHKALIAAVSSRITPDDAVLECACGTGLLTGAIAERCRTLLATDFSANMLKRAKKKYGALPNVTFRQADILHLDEPDGQFDVVIAANVIHLLDEPYKALAELDRVCRSGGTRTEMGFADTRYLSSEVAGGFTGVMIGLYAVDEAGRTADFTDLHLTHTENS